MDYRRDYISEEGLLDAAFDPTCGNLILRNKITTNDRCTYDLRRIDDFLNTRDTLCDAHAGHTSEMERFQGHLSPRLANGLCSDGTDRRPWLYLGSVVFCQTSFYESHERMFRQFGDTFHKKLGLFTYPLSAPTIKTCGLCTHYAVCEVTACLETA